MTMPIVSWGVVVGAREGGGSQSSRERPGGWNERVGRRVQWSTLSDNDKKVAVNLWARELRGGGRGGLGHKVRKMKMRLLHNSVSCIFWHHFLEKGRQKPKIWHPFSRKGCQMLQNLNNRNCKNVTTYILTSIFLKIDIKDGCFPLY